MTRGALLWNPTAQGRIHCRLCSHRCKIAPGRFGICGVREHRDGQLVTHAYGEVIAANRDPIEKKPLYHFLPGSRSFSVGTPGCNFQCGFCQNWQISQTRKKDGVSRMGRRLDPQEIVEQALATGCRSIAYTYTEPTIFFEYARDTARLARRRGLFNLFVTNGYLTREALEEIRPHLDACNVDLKSFDDRFYQNICRARLQPVLDSIRAIKKLGIWLEVTTLVVPKSNDSDRELSKMARFLAGLDPEIPWHLSRFHPDYHYDHTPATPLATLERARSLGHQAGLRHVYLGNLPGHTSDTLCPGCGGLLIRRSGLGLLENHLLGSGCPSCGRELAGIFRP